ncbi:MAG: hypothetical protein ACRED9_06580 [Caulobacteraceae bacterium]
MDRTDLGSDWRGDFILSSQVWSTARDLARLGVLYLDDGMWNGERLFPAGWSRFVATPAPAQSAVVRTGGPGYGGFFWLFGPAQGLPAGTDAMMGARGQYVFIVPARNLVIVRRGFDAFSGPQFDMARFCRDVLAALPGKTDAGPGREGRIPAQIDPPLMSQGMANLSTTMPKALAK